MDPELKAVLAEYITALADDELLLGHRDSEWCGHAPILEEDIAFANIALDEIGHAILWYELLAGLAGEDRDSFPDRMVYERAEQAFRHAGVVVLPNGDWAFTIVRQYLFDLAESVRLEQLVESSHAPLAEVAAKIRREELYHLRHSAAWVRRLGLGTEESNRRMAAALAALWEEAQGLFAPVLGEKNLVAAGVVPPGEELQEAWAEKAREHLEAAGLAVPDGGERALVERGVVCDHLKLMLKEMRAVARAYPGARW